MEGFYTKDFFPYRCDKCYLLGEQGSQCCGRTVVHINPNNVVHVCKSCNRAYTTPNSNQKKFGYCYCYCGERLPDDRTSVVSYYEKLPLSSGNEKSIIEEIRSVKEQLAIVNERVKQLSSQDISLLMNKAINLCTLLSGYKEQEDIGRDLKNLENNLESFRVRLLHERTNWSSQKESLRKTLPEGVESAPAVEVVDV